MPNLRDLIVTNRQENPRATTHARRRATTALALALLTTSPVALAADAPPPVSKMEQEATALCQEAMVHVRKSEFEEALRLYEKAYSLDPSLSILFNLGLTALNAGHPLEALTSFRTYMKADGADRGKIALLSMDLLPKAMEKTAHLDVSEAPRGARFAVDGQPAEAAEGNVLDVLPGLHHLTAKSGGETREADVRAPAAVRTPVSFPSFSSAFDPVPPMRPAVSEVAVAAPPSAEAPATVATRSGGARRTVALTLGGAAVATGVGSIVFFALNRSAQRRYESLHQGLGRSSCSASSLAAAPENAGPCADLASAIDDNNRDASVSLGLLIATGVLATAAILTYVVWPAHRSAAARVLPLVDPVGRSVGIVGAF